MASTAPNGWSLLKTNSSKSKKQKQCPKLFYNFSASPKDGIKLLLTDLISLWRCSLARSKVTSSASEKHTSIDPSESTEQMKVFLDKLALALHSGTNKLARDDNEDTNLRPLVLKSTVDLPKPLKPLEWTFTLWPQAASELAATVLRPTLHQLSKTEQKLDSLIGVIKDKDHVIERLLGRVAEKGVDMSLIFPTLTGTAKRGGSGVKVEDAKKLVPGMKAFELKAWEHGFRQDDQDAKAQLGLSELVAGCENCFIHSKADHAESMSSWVQKLPGAQSLENVAPKSSMGRSQSPSQSQFRADEETESENEFETQADPPQTKKRSSPEIADDNTSDEDRERASKRTKTGAGKLGALGRNSRSESKTPAAQEKTSSPIPPAKIPLLPKQRVSDASSATETASESNDEPKPKSPTQSPAKTSRVTGVGKSFLTSKSPQPQRSPSSDTRPPTANSEATTPSRRLGRIGNGRLRTATASPIPESAVHNHHSDNKEQDKQRSQPTTRPRKLGRIGMRAKDKSKATSQAQDSGVASGSAAPSARTRNKSNLDSNRKQRDKTAIENENESDDATASPSPSPSPSPGHPSPKKALHDCKDNEAASRPSPSSVDRSNQGEEKKEEERQQESEEQRATRRREELKRTIQTSGPKKKRRF